MTRTAFMSIAAAEGNLGDIYIRRAVTRLIDSADGSAAIYTGKMGQSYIAAFRLPPGWLVTNSPRRFLTAMIGACLRRRAVIIMAPGPTALASAAAPLAKKIGVVALLTAASLIGNPVMVLGRAVRGDSRASLLAERVMARISSIYLARDPFTADLVGVPARLAPDLGFAPTATEPAATPTPEARGTVAISLRFDRDPQLDRVAQLVREWREAGLDPVFVTQVREDGPNHVRMAEALDVRCIDWPENRTHQEQETAVTHEYSRCVAVVSDRLHALIVGARCGALPVIADSAGESKLHASLDFILDAQAVWLHGGAECLTTLDFSEAEMATAVATTSAARDLAAPLQHVATTLSQAGREVTE